LAVDDPAVIGFTVGKIAQAQLSILRSIRPRGTAKTVRAAHQLAAMPDYSL
jgi:hypothetical protein